MDYQNSEDISEQMFNSVADVYGFPRIFASIHSKMQKKLSLNTDETNISEQVDFSFYALATCIQAASAQADTWPRMKDTIRQRTTMESKSTSYNCRRYIRELIQNAKDVLIPTEKAIWKLKLEKNGFTFSHNGRPFSGGYSGASKQLGEAYSLFHTSSTTKSLDFSTVGQFGIGFKGWVLFCDEILISCSDGKSITAEIGWKGNDTGNVEITELKHKQETKERKTTFRFTSEEEIDWTETESGSTKSTIEILIEECMQLISIRDQPVEFVVELNGASSKIEHQISTPREPIDETAPRSWFYECQTAKVSTNGHNKTIKNSIIELEIIPHSDVNAAIDDWLARQKEMYNGLANNPFADDKINASSWYRSDTESGQSVRFCISTEDDFENRSWLSNLVPIDHGIDDSDILISESRWLIDGPLFLSDNRLKLRAGSVDGNANIISQSLKRGFSSLCKRYLDNNDLVNYRRLLKIPESRSTSSIITKITTENSHKKRIENMFGEVNNVFRNCINDEIKNSDVRCLDKNWTVNEKSFIQIIEEECNNGRLEMIARTFPELPTINLESKITIITEDDTFISQHMQQYSPSEMYEKMKQSGLIGVLAEKYPGIQRSKFVLPPIPENINRIIFGNSSDEDELMDALIPLQDDHNFKIITDTADDIYAAYSSEANTNDWNDITINEGRTVAVIKAPEDCNSNWMVDRILQCISNSNNSLCNETINKYHDEINNRNKKAELSWVSSDANIYGHELEENSKIWVKLSYIAEAKRNRSILFGEGSVWHGEWSHPSPDWTWLNNSNMKQKVRVNDLENIITSSTFRNGHNFVNSDEVALLGAEGLIPSSIIEAIKFGLRNVEWNNKNYIILLNLDPSQLSDKIHNSWNFIPRFIINQHVRQIDRNRLKQQTTRLPGNLDTLKEHVKEERIRSKLLGNIFDLEMKKFRGNNVPRILIREINLTEFIDFVQFKQDITGEFDCKFINSIQLIHSQKQKLPTLRNCIVSVFKSGQKWWVESKKINNFGLTKQGKNLSHNAGSFEPEDELFDPIRQNDEIFALGFEENEETGDFSFVVSDEEQLLHRIFGNSFLIIAKTELIRLDECPVNHKQNNFDGLAAIVRHMVNQEVDDDTISLANILCENITFAAGLTEEDNLKLSEMRTYLEEAFTDQLHSQYRDHFLPIIRSHLSPENYNVIDQLGSVIATSSISKEEIVAEIVSREHSPSEAWNFYVEKGTWLSDDRWFFNNQNFAKSNKAFDTEAILLTETMRSELFPHAMHDVAQKRKMTGWRPPDKSHICVLPRNHQIDFMVESPSPSAPSFRYNFSSALKLERQFNEIEEEHKRRWSFLSGLIGLYHSAKNEFTDFEFAYLDEGASTTECTSYKLGNKPLCLGEHGWDLSDLDGMMAIRTNSPRSPTPQQLNCLKIFVMHIFDINRIQLSELLLNDSTKGKPSLSKENRDTLARILKTDRKILDPLLEEMHNKKTEGKEFFDFYNPFHASLHDGVPNQSDKWWNTHGGSSKWSEHVNESLEEDGAARIFDAYQEAISSLLRNPIPSDDFQETCALLKIRKNARLDRKFESDLYHGFHSMLMDEPRIWTPVDGVAPKMHISKLNNRSSSNEYELLKNADLVDFPGNVLFVSPFTSHRMSMTASAEGIQRLEDIKFGQVNANGTLRECLFKKHLKSWGGSEEKYVTLKHVMNFIDGTDSTKMSLRVHKFHFVLIAAMDAALREYISLIEGTD